LLHTQKKVLLIYQNYYYYLDKAKTLFVLLCFYQGSQVQNTEQIMGRVIHNQGNKKILQEYWGLKKAI
jgi:hypothetical protein